MGRVSSLFVYPMSFDEFLTATGQEGLLRTKRNSSPTNPLLEAFYNRLVEAFRSYMLVGGMPEAVATYMETGSYRYSSDIVNEIIQGIRTILPSTEPRQILCFCAKLS